MSDGRSAFVDIVLVRKGGRLAAIVLTDLTAPDQTLLESIVSKQADKL